MSDLDRKLGAAPGKRVVALGAELDLGGEITVRRRLSRGTDVIVFFCHLRAELEDRLPSLREALAPAGGLWIAWPKRSSGMQTDLTDHIIREVLLATGLVDNKVCAIDATYTGLRFVVRKELR